MSTEQQPVVQAYPNSVTAQPSSHSNGSFGSVFIVLAVIIIISAIACFLGRLCNRRNLQPKDKKSHGSKQRDMRPKNAVRSRDGDIEFGFENGINPSTKHFGNGGAKGSKPGGKNGETRVEPRFAGEWEGKAGQY